MSTPPSTPYSEIYDIYDMLNSRQLEQVAEIFMEALGDHGIHPEVWEMTLKAEIYEEGVKL